MFGGVVGLFWNWRSVGRCAEIGLLKRKIHDQIAGNHERDDQRQPGDHTGVLCHCFYAEHAPDYRMGTAACQSSRSNGIKMAAVSMLVPGGTSVLDALASRG